MMRFFSKFFTYLAIVLVSSPLAFAGLGVSPSYFYSSSLYKGSSIEKSFIISRSNPSEDMDITVTFEGGSADWLSTDKGNTFTLPANQQRVPLVVYAKVPLDTANGNYSGKIRIEAVRKDSELLNTNSASVALSLVIETNFEVTGDQILDYDISAMHVEDAAVDSPLGLILIVKNSGNVKARPTKILMEVFNKLRSEVLVEHEITEMNSVDPLTTDAIVVEIPNTLDIGSYWARVKVYSDEDLIKEESLMFEVKQNTELGNQNSLKDLQHPKFVSKGDSVDIVGIYKNLSDLNHPAKLQTTIYKNDKKIKTVIGETKMVKIGDSVSLKAQYIPEKTGTYTLKTKVLYAGGTTDESVTTLKVENNNVLLDYVKFIPVVFATLLIYALKKGFK